MVNLLHMLGSVAVGVFELTFVLRQQWACSVEIVFLSLVVEGQRIELAAQGFVVAQLAALCAKMCAFVFDAQVLMNRSFGLCERDF
jgi:hypothetical protein